MVISLRVAADILSKTIPAWLATFELSTKEPTEHSAYRPSAIPQTRLYAVEGGVNENANPYASGQIWRFRSDPTPITCALRCMKQIFTLAAS